MMMIFGYKKTRGDNLNYTGCLKIMDLNYCLCTGLLYIIILLWDYLLFTNFSNMITVCIYADLFKEIQNLNKIQLAEVILNEHLRKSNLMSLFLLNGLTFEEIELNMCVDT